MTNYRPFTKRLQRALWKHGGKWVAIDHQRIIAAGDTPREVFEAAQRAGVEVPMLYRVPSQDERHFYLFGEALAL